MTRTVHQTQPPTPTATKVQLPTSGGTTGKTLLMLDIIADFGHPVRFSDIQAKSPFPKASTFRFVQTMVKQQMLTYDAPSQSYNLGFRLVRLAHCAWKQASLAPIARNSIDALANKTGQTIHLAQLDCGQVLYIDKRVAKQPVTMFSDTGKIGPAYCTGVGKAMLAFLPRHEQEKHIAQQCFYRHTDNTITTAEQLWKALATIKKDGKSFDSEEHEPGIICIAVPICTPSGQVIGGISITGSTQQTSLAQLDGYSNDLKTTAHAIGNIAGDWQFPQLQETA